MFIRTIAILAVLAAAPSAALAQSFTPSIRIGQNVWVTNTDGNEVRGEVVAISSAAVDLFTAVGAKHFSLNEVWMIHKKDPNTQGFLIGAGVGLFSGWIGSACVPRNEQAGFIVFSTFFYGGIGALIDNAIVGRTMVYHRPERASGDAVINITPIVRLDGPRRVGLGGTITWK